MLPIVYLHHLELPVNISAPTHTNKCKRRKKNRRMLFRRIKRRNAATARIRARCERRAHWTYQVPEKPSVDFLGFTHESHTSSLTGNFQGFSNADIALSFAKYVSLKAIAEDSRLMRCHQTISVNFQQVQPLRKRAIRVLSLFDGISTGLHILHKLGLHVEIYFSSEIDPCAFTVQKDNFYGKMIRLGDVKHVTSDVLKALGRIDLLLGGSPCNEISRVNWRRKGVFDGSSTGPLVFEYVRVRDFLAEEAAKRGDVFFWLFENTFNMDSITHEVMSTELRADSLMCCSSSFLPVYRRRHFWGNIPNMLERGKQMQHFKPQSLSEILMPFRKACVRMIPTLTTNVSSQRTGMSKKYPILEDGVESPLTPNERELLMDLPKNYTAALLKTTQRVQVLGRAWCVPVVQYLLEPLADIYMKESEML